MDFPRDPGRTEGRSGGGFTELSVGAVDGSGVREQVRGAGWGFYGWKACALRNSHPGACSLGGGVRFIGQT